MVSEAARQLQRREPDPFLRDPKRHLRGQKAILIWDDLPGHKSRKMHQYLDSQNDWLSVEMLPGYSLDLNPVEDLWGECQRPRIGQSPSRTSTTARHVSANSRYPSPSSTMPDFSFDPIATLLCEVQ
jgi:transposase